MRIDRRALLALACASVPLLTTWRRAGAAPPDAAAIRALVRSALLRDPSTVLGLDAEAAGEVLLRATKSDALPDAYVPEDLVATSAHGIAAFGRQLIRRVIVDDTRALVDAAAADGVRLYVGSGYRSQTYQVDVFAAQTARWGDAEVANRYSARPGHSQHQLGTTIDFTADFRNFRSSGAADWLREHAHQFGFILPYTVAATDRTGYVDEPWHGRWVGGELAHLLQSLGYQEWPELDADDAVAVVRQEAGLDA